MHSAILSAPVTFLLHHAALVRGRGDEVTTRKMKTNSNKSNLNTELWHAISVVIYLFSLILRKYGNVLVFAKC